MPESLNDLMAWFFDVDVTEDRSYNDALYQALTEARAANATFADLIALIP